MLRRCLFFFVVGFVMTSVPEVRAQIAFNQGAKLFVAPMPDGFDTYLKTAFERKKVPVTFGASRDEADFELTGSSETQKAGNAKKILKLDWHSDEQASVSIANLKSGQIVFAYSANKKSSVHGKRSTAEACAKHIKDELNKKK